MINYKKIIILILVIFMCFVVKDYITRCIDFGANNKINSIEKNSYMKSLHMNTYEMEILVTYYANDMKSIYKIIHEYNNGNEKLTYKEPEKFNGMTVEVNEDGIVHMNPYIQQNITYYADAKKHYNNILFSSFAHNFLNDRDSEVKVDNSKEYVLKCTIPGDNYYFKYQECYISKETNNPLRIVIKSKDKVKTCEVAILSVQDIKIDKNVEG